MKIIDKQIEMVDFIAIINLAGFGIIIRRFFGWFGFLEFAIGVFIGSIVLIKSRAKRK